MSTQRDEKVAPYDPLRLCVFATSCGTPGWWSATSRSSRWGAVGVALLVTRLAA
ncbi:hypothetical protein BH10ACT10_BH10ACT10_27200 [soil metagenome]